MSGSIQIEQCPICTSAHMKKKWVVNGYSVVSCNNCGFIFVNPQPTSEALDEFYSSEYFSGGGEGFGYSDYSEHDQQDSDRGKNNAALYGHVLGYIESKVKVGRMLEIGSAFGGFLSAAMKRGWEVVGVEKSRHCCEVMEQQGIKAVCGDVWDAGLNKGVFDAVYCSMAIEHFTDPARVVENVSDVLRKDGVFVVRTVDIGSFNARSNNLVHKITGRHLWSEIKPPEHLSFFSKRTLAGLLDEKGFHTHVLAEYDHRTYAEARFNNPVLAAASVVLKPVLRLIPAGSAMTVVGVKSA